MDDVFYTQLFAKQNSFEFVTKASEVKLSDMNDLILYILWLLQKFKLLQAKNVYHHQDKRTGGQSQEPEVWRDVSKANESESQFVS